MGFRPEYTITHKILTYVSRAETAKDFIENSPIIPFWERTFRTQALARTIHHSTAIEGNELNLEQTGNIIKGKQITTFRTRDLLEIVNYRDVVKYIDTYSKKYITLGFIFKVHNVLGKKLLPEKFLGKLREQNAVIINSQTGEVVFDAPFAADVLDELEELIEWDREQVEIHPLLRAGILHFELVRIHPFVDLNGRTARILATWSLYRDGYDIKRFFSLEEYYDQDPKKYYDALNSAHSGDMSQWLEYFTYGVALELERVKEKVLDLSKDRRLKQKVGQIALNERQLKLIAYIQQHKIIQNPQFSELFPEISDDTILRDLRDLIDKNIIVKKGKTRSSRYELI